MTAVRILQQERRAQSQPQQNNSRHSTHTSNMSPSRSRPQSYASSGQGESTPTQNGTTNGTSSRSLNTVQQNGVHTQHSKDEDTPSASTRNVILSSNSAGHGGRAPLQARPSSAPNGIAESSQDDSETDKTRRRPVPMLQRAKSDFGPRGEEPDTGEEIQDWGARHGFEDHYASEEYVSQLANVSDTFSTAELRSRHRGIDIARMFTSSVKPSGFFLASTLLVTSSLHCQPLMEYKDVYWAFGLRF